MRRMMLIGLRVAFSLSRSGLPTRRSLAVKFRGRLKPILHYDDSPPGTVIVKIVILIFNA